MWLVWHNSKLKWLWKDESNVSVNKQSGAKYEVWELTKVVCQNDDNVESVMMNKDDYVRNKSM